MALRGLEGAVYHFHAKDTRVDPHNHQAKTAYSPQPVRQSSSIGAG